jgi:hypothetical protein
MDSDPISASRLLLASAAFAPATCKTWINLGNTIRDLCDSRGALGCYEHAAFLGSLDPVERTHARVNAAMEYIRLGEWERGWELYESRYALPEFIARNALNGGDASKMWRRSKGKAVAGKTLLVFNEQGAGDTIMCLRYLTQLPSSLHIVARVPASLLRLARASFPTIDIVSDGERLPDHDYLTPFMSLPFHTGRAPHARPYLNTYPGEALLASKYPSIGIVWAGSPHHAKDAERSIALEQFAPLFETPHVSWVSLQVGPKANEIRRFPDVRTVQTSDYYDTACVMKSLDLVISVDSSPCHLAGALGVPVWTLLPKVADFRWMIDSETTPFYSSMRLIRQQTRGDWSSVIQQVRRGLESLIASRSAA